MGRMMVEIPIPPKWKQLWDTLDLRGFIILSLSLQTFLILFAPLRKRTKSNWIIIPLWSAYLLADWAANFAIGLISSSQLGNPTVSSGKELGGGNAVRNVDLLAFWAPFLLVHLGGPETITAFALEDNELWRRHLLGLVFQCLATVYVFVLSLPQNRLWIPTMLMFMTGIIKYAERTHSFYLASADRFKDSGFDMDAFVTIDLTKKKNLTELEVVQYAYRFFKESKGLVVGMFYNWCDPVKIRAFFMNRTAKDAFKVVEVELNFIYEVLYTKLPVVYRRFGAMSRSFSLVTVCSATVLFMFKNKSNLSSGDVTITYGLLFGALALDIIALFMLLFSDWTIISLRRWPHDHELDKSIKTRIVTSFLRLMTEAGTLRNPKDNALPSTSRWPIRVFKRRWSESISTFNLIDYFLHQHGYLKQFVYEKLGNSRFLDEIKYVKTKKFTPKLRDFIWKEIKLRLELADKSLRMAMDMYSPRGDWVLGEETSWSSLLPHVNDLDYDQSILVWHIATELCYNNELKSKTPVKDHREIAKLLSDYMLYLLIMQPSKMLAVTGTGQESFQGIYYEANLIFIDEEANKDLEPGDKDMACSKIRAIQPRLSRLMSTVEKFLFDGSCLAKKLEKIEEEGNGLDKWLIISKVWVELLCYGAINSRANTHAAQMSRGGELITIIWLLMSHLALDKLFEPKDGIDGMLTTENLRKK